MNKRIFSTHDLFNIENILNGIFNQKPAVWNYPVMDVYSVEDENKKVKLVYEIAVPGIKPEDISVEVDDSQGYIRVTQTSEKVDREQDENRRYYMQRIGKRKFNVVLMLPSTHTIEDKDVVIENGMLTITLHQKDKPEDKVRKLQPLVVGKEIERTTEQNE